MSENVMEKKIESLLGLKAFKSEVDEEIKKLEAELKDEMEARGDLQHLNVANKYTIHWAYQIRNVFQSAVFKKLHSDVYAAFCSPQETRRFEITKM